MAVVFNIATYDVGGRGAIAGDKKLTGEEVVLAQQAGWNVKENHTIDMGIPDRIEEKKDDSFFKFTDSKGDFSFKETGKTIIKCLCLPLIAIDVFIIAPAQRRREELEDAKFRNAWNISSY